MREQPWGSCQLCQGPHCCLGEQPGLQAQGLLTQLQKEEGFFKEKKLSARVWAVAVGWIFRALLPSSPIPLGMGGTSHRTQRGPIAWVFGPLELSLGDTGVCPRWP